MNFLWLRHFRVATLAIAVGAFISIRLQAESNGSDSGRSTPSLEWRQLASIPDRLGFGYPFVGVHNDVLIVAGGANFPGALPWEGGTKVWHDNIYVLESMEGEWRNAGRLRRRLGYGVSLTTPRGIACLGGSDATRHYADCFLLTWNGRECKETPLPSLPRPCANFCGVFVGNTIYLAGGIETPASTETLSTFWSLDLNDLGTGWKQLEPWPGKGRMLATMAEQGGAVYLFSGVALRADANGKPQREYLKDAYRYEPAEGWRRIADLPRPAVAAPTPALNTFKQKILIVGGDDGMQVNTPPAKHVGFPRTILTYDTIANSWQATQRIPFSYATVPAVLWKEHLIIPGGEERPGIRSNRVWAAKRLRTAQ